MKEKQKAEIKRWKQWVKDNGTSEMVWPFNMWEQSEYAVTEKRASGNYGTGEGNAPRWQMRKYTHRNAKEIWNEGEDGWWAILKDGLVIDDCKGVHEQTIKGLLSRLNDARAGEER